ncbi:TIM barrel protein [Paracoccus sp. TOH]|uniref:hydroxypyruvate isomerase family protein n=1 Tax=Paracoccus sp. TOH TaxID=1263728 RepID=UPI0025B14AE1|nr:TIM barrel protein [Paracoccus sp. TOH]WJS86522.1 TIM barrel protein [Paracoccus sp. TOH]
MTRFSANLGFLWADLPLPQAIRAAHRAGFHAVECHWPYAVPPEQTAAALAETGLAMLGLNTARGRPGENGLAALPGREAEARAGIEQALDYARAIGCPAVHVMAGFAEGDAAGRVFRANLDHACRLARPHGIAILIEPLNRHDAPGYFLTGSDQAARIIKAAGHDNLRLMFDCYHLQIMEGGISRRLRQHREILGHVQIAAVPDRGAPDHGELDYRHVYGVLQDLGWTRPLGAEYRPGRPTDETLGWLAAFRGPAARETS